MLIIVSIYENFEDDNVIVVLDTKVSKINKIHNVKYFSGIEIESTQTIKLSDFVDGKYKLLLYEQNSPYPWIQYFNCSVFVPCQETEILVTMDQYGF